MKDLKRVVGVIWVVGVALVMGGCVGGGSVVSREASNHEVLVAYQPDGGGPDADYFLVRTERGLGLLERDHAGAQALASTHWRAEDGDHFAIWVSFLSRQGGAFEYVIPLDRTQPAKRYAYPAGSYSIVQMDGIERPVPANPTRYLPIQLIPRSESRL